MRGSGYPRLHLEDDVNAHIHTHLGREGSVIHSDLGMPHVLCITHREHTTQYG